MHQTPDELEVDGKFVLKEAGVDCDSGAKGWYYFVQGMLMGTRGSVSLDGVLGKDLLESADGIESVSEEFAGGEKHRYCTECVVRLKQGCSKDDVAAALSGSGDGDGDGAGGAGYLGDSMVVVSAPAADGSGEICKVHIHSDTPGKVFETMTSRFSSNPGAPAIKEKVEDMPRQVKNAHRADAVRAAVEGFKVGVVHIALGCRALAMHLRPTLFPSLFKVGVPVVLDWDAVHIGHAPTTNSIPQRVHCLPGPLFKATP